MVSTEVLNINNERYNVHILTYYDGVKEEVDLTHNVLFLWYDYDEDMNGEYWFKIKPLEKIDLYKYLSNRIGISELINHSAIVLCYRSYDNYQEIIVKDEIKKKNDYKMPDDVTLGYNFISLLGEKIETKKKYDPNTTEKEIKSVIDTNELEKISTLKDQKTILKDLDKDYNDYEYAVAA